MLTNKFRFSSSKTNQLIQENFVKHLEAKFYFLVISDLNARVKYLVTRDTFGKREVEFSSFIGDDILIKTGNSFMIFN